MNDTNGSNVVAFTTRKPIASPSAIKVKEDSNGAVDLNSIVEFIKENEEQTRAGLYLMLMKDGSIGYLQTGTLTNAELSWLGEFLKDEAKGVNDLLEAMARYTMGGRLKDLKKLKKGDSVIYKNVGYGLTSYELYKNEVQGVKKGKLFTNCYDSIGMEWDEGRKTWKFDGGLGLVSYVCAADDPVALKGLADPNN